MENIKIKKGRQWEEGISMFVSNTFYIRKKEQGITVTELVYDELRRMILHDDIKPGSWLRQDLITNQLGVSRTPIREAFRSLHQDGLVELVPNYGARVANLTIDEFEEIYAHRKGIEGLAVRRAVVKLSFEYMHTLQSMIDSLMPLAKTSTLAEYLKEEWNFRYKLYAVGGRESFLKQIKEYRERAERYLRYAYFYKGSIQDSFKFHQQLLAACKQADVKKAEQIVQKTLSWTVEKAGPIIMEKLTAIQIEEGK